MKKAFLLITLFFWRKCAIAQTGLEDRYQYNFLAINQAFAGETGTFGIKAITENQLSGALNFNKLSQILVLDGQLYGNAGLAFQGYRISSGNLNSAGMQLAYSKGFIVGDLITKVGIGGGIFIQPNLLSLQQNQRTLPHAGAGLMVDFKGAFLSLSKPVIIASKNYFDTKSEYAAIGYNRNEINEKLNLSAYFLLRKENSNLAKHYNFRAGYNNKIFGGFSLRTNETGIRQKNAIFPYLKYNFSPKFQMGLGYFENPISISQIPNTPLAFSGNFQIFFKFLNNQENPETTIGKLFNIN